MDDVIDIIMDEASEDLAKMGGGSKDIDLDTKPLVAVKTQASLAHLASIDWSNLGKYCGFL